MCDHEDRQCPGIYCPCECMNCQFPFDPDEEEVDEDILQNWADKHA